MSEELPDPIDIRTRGEIRIRMVPTVGPHLLCVQVTIPQDDYEQIQDVVGGWSDVEMSDGRLIRRGRINPATNLYIDTSQTTATGDTSKPEPIDWSKHKPEEWRIVGPDETAPPFPKVTITEQKVAGNVTTT
jgi:hypothetical protein